MLRFCLWLGWMGTTPASVTQTLTVTSTSTSLAILIASFTTSLPVATVTFKMLTTLIADAMVCPAHLFWNPHSPSRGALESETCDLMKISHPNALQVTILHTQRNITNSNHPPSSSQSQDKHHQPPSPPPQPQPQLQPPIQPPPHSKTPTQTAGKPQMAQMAMSCIHSPSLSRPPSTSSRFAHTLSRDMRRSGRPCEWSRRRARMR